jgi:hypothetical protein
MNAISKSVAHRDWRGFAVFAGWGVLYIAARLLLELESLGWWPRLVVALVPVPTFAWVLWSVSKGIAEMDELQRRIQLEALAFAFPLTLLLLMTLGLIELAVGLNPDDWSYRHVSAMLPVFYFGGIIRAKRRYE